MQQLHLVSISKKDLCTYHTISEGHWYLYSQEKNLFHLFLQFHLVLQELLQILFCIYTRLLVHVTDS